MTDETTGLLYCLSVLIVWQLGIMFCRKSLENKVNDTGNWIFVVGVCWPLVLGLMLLVLFWSALTDVLTMMFKVDLTKGVKKLWKK
jgi:hypothetical protein